jgi:hypothetical protein
MAAFLEVQVLAAATLRHHYPCVQGAEGAAPPPRAPEYLLSHPAQGTTPGPTRVPVSVQLSRPTV